jgi:hypothetical protein
MKAFRKIKYAEHDFSVSVDGKFHPAWAISGDKTALRPCSARLKVPTVM